MPVVLPVVCVRVLSFDNITGCGIAAIDVVVDAVDVVRDIRWITCAGICDVGLYANAGANVYGIYGCVVGY